MKSQLLPDLFHPISRLLVAAGAPTVPLENPLNEATFGSGPPLICARREGDERSSNECQASLLYLWVNIVEVLEPRLSVFVRQQHSSTDVGGEMTQSFANKETKPSLVL